METQFPTLADITAIYSFVKELGDRHYPKIQYSQLTVRPEFVDDYHMEVRDRDKEFLPPVSLPMFVKPEIEIRRHSKFPLEVVRNLEIHISVPHLVEAGLATQDSTTRVVSVSAKAGDRFVYSGVTYDVLSVRRGEPWANTDIPIFYVVRAERYRPSIADLD